MAFRVLEGGLTTEPVAQTPTPSRFRVIEGGPLEAFGRRAVASLGPTAAGFAGMRLGAGIGSVGGPVTTAIGAGIGGLGGAVLGQLLQSRALHAVAPEFAQRFEIQRAEDVQRHPVASLLGQAVPSLAGFGLGIPRTLQQLGTATVSGGLQGGLEAGAEFVTEKKITPARIATAAGIGLVQTRPTRLGQRLIPTLRQGTPSLASVSEEAGTPPVTSKIVAPPRVQPEGPHVSAQVVAPSVTERAATPSNITGPQRTSILPPELTVGSIDSTSGKKILQPTANVNRLMRAAVTERAGLERLLQETVAEVPEASLRLVRVKEPTSLNRKLAQGTRNPATVSDYLGGRIMVNREEDAVSVLAALRRRGDVIDVESGLQTDVARVKGGYRADHASVRLPSGLSAEVKIMTPEMAQAKVRVDFLRQGLRNPNSPQVQQIAIQRQMSKVFGHAQARYLARAQSTPRALTSPRLGVPATQDITTAAQRLIQRDPTDVLATEEAPRLFRRIGQALREGRIAAEDVPALRDAGLTTQEAAGLFEEAATFSGQTLNRLSQVWRQIQTVAPELAKTVDQVPEPPLTSWQRLQSLPQKVVNLWRASLVSQMATAVRNFAVFHQRLAFKVIEDGVNGAFESVTGGHPPRQAFGPMIEDVFAYGRALTRGNRWRILGLLEQSEPLLKEKLMRTPVNDATVTGRYAKLLGTFNNAQEYFARTVAADAVMAGEMRRAGVSAPTIPMMTKAVDRALDLTFAKYPSSKTGQAFLKAWNNPILNVLTYPFPRYLTNAIRAIWEHSPVGAMRLLSPKYQAILRSGDPRTAVEVATRAGLGTAMFAAASWIRNSQFAGEKWYEVRVGEKTVDVRPFGPLLPVYLFLAQAAKDDSQFELRDWVEGTLGINRMAGTTLFLTSVLAGQNPATLKKKIAEFLGEFAGGFTVPLRTFQDFVAQFSMADATIRDTKLSPLTGPAISNIPFAARTLPPKLVVTRGGPIRREQPGLRQLTGLTIRTKTPLEHELDRLGISPFQLEPRLGERSIERAIVARMGPVAARRFTAIVQSPAYQRLNDEQRKEVLTQQFSLLRKGAKAHLIQTDPQTVARPLRPQFRSATPEQRRKLLKTLQRKGLLRSRVPQALLR